MWKIGLVFVAVASPAFAQQGSGVNWGLAGPGFDASQPMRAYQGALDARLREDQQRAFAAQQRSEQTAATDQQALRRQAGTMVAAGQCEQARNTALAAGDFTLADEAKRACQ